MSVAAIKRASGLADRFSTKNCEGTRTSGVIALSSTSPPQLPVTSIITNPPPHRRAKRAPAPRPSAACDERGRASHACEYQRAGYARAGNPRSTMQAWRSQHGASAPCRPPSAGRLAAFACARAPCGRAALRHAAQTSSVTSASQPPSPAGTTFRPWSVTAFTSAASAWRVPSIGSPCSSAVTR